MQITKVKWMTPVPPNTEQEYVLVSYIDARGDEANIQFHKDTDDENARRAVKAWLDAGNVIEPADPLDPDLTNEELIDIAGPVMIAFLKAFAKREGITLKQLRDAIVAEM